jgi:hypothetical protein
MKIESTQAEQVEAYALGLIGAVQGVYRQVIKPCIENQPIALYALAGVLGGLAIAKLIGLDSEIN